MARYQQLFTQLSAKKEGAFIPFVVLGDPNRALSAKILSTLVASGADALEVSIPFSDPLADGPEIQGAVLRALENGATIESAFSLLSEVREASPQLPIGLLMYANLIYAYGVEAFYRRCKEIGIDSVLVADLPLRESAPFNAIAKAQGIAPIFICPPDATDEAIAGIAEEGRGYTYLVSRAGVTGIDQASTSVDSDDLQHNIARLKAAKAAPIVQGFGISTPAQARYYLEQGVAGVISGSAVTQIIRENLDNETLMLEKLADFIRQMKQATKEISSGDS